MVYPGVCRGGGIYRVYYMVRPGGMEESRPKGGIASLLTLLVSSASALAFPLVRLVRGSRRCH